MPTIFDFDGVLADSEPIHERAFHDVIDPLGWKLTHEQFRHEFVGKSDLVCFRLLVAWEEEPKTEEELLELRAQKTVAFQARVHAGEVQAFPGALELLRAAERLGVVGVCSGSIDGVVRPVLERFGVAPLLKSISTSDRVPAPKPDPRGYLLAAKEMGVDQADCTATEDTPTGIKAAKAAGMRCFAVAHSFTPEALQSADRVYARIADIDPADLA